MSLEAIANIAEQNPAEVGAVIGQKISIMPSVAVASATPAAPVQTEASVGITLTPEQWAEYTKVKARIAELEEIERHRAAEAQAAEIKALQSKGQIEQAFNLHREQSRHELEVERKKLKDTEDRAKRYALDCELARALTAQPLVPGGAEQLTELWRSKFAVEAHGDSLAVRAPDFQPVGAWIAAQLGRPEYSHFLRPQNPSGGTQGGALGMHGAPTTPANAATEAIPKNLSEAVLMQIAAGAKSSADPRLTPTLSFGLRPSAPRFER